MEDIVIQIENLKKKYRLGSIGGRTLTEDIESWWAKKRGMENPNRRIATDGSLRDEEFWALNGISLSIKRGETVGIIGLNGAGKSTLLKILSRVTAPTEGVIRIKGRIASMLEIGTGFHGELTGRQNIYLNGSILGMKKAEIDSKIEDIITFSECEEFIDTPVKRYSSGMYVKLAFSVAAHLDADIMLMDEVLAVGDALFQHKCLDKMSSLARSEQKTILYVSHNMNTVRRLCRRCIVLKDGRLIYDGSVEDGITNYLGLNMESMGNRFDLRERNIMSVYSTGKVKLLSLTIDGRNNVVTPGSKLGLCMEIFFHDPVDAFAVRSEVFTALAEPVGVCMSSLTDGGEKGEVKKVRMELDISHLASGKYYFNFILFFPHGDGTSEVYAIADNAMYITVSDITGGPYNMSWRSYWGHYMMPEILIK